MRLSTADSRDDDVASRTIHAALDAGVRLLDTANVYCLHEGELGHNERLIARTLEQWTGNRAAVDVATKGGLIRRGRRWIPDGRAKQLMAACDASRQMLGVETIDLYQLHAVDPRTPLETSVRAMARLQEQGKVARVGLCNVTVSQIAVARAIVPISTVQVQIHPFDDTNLRNGVAEYCRDQGIRVLVYRPFGGDRHRRVARDPELTRIADRYGVTPYQVVLAWLADLAPDTLPLAGATRVETAAALRDVARAVLTDRDRRTLDHWFPAGRLMRVPRAARQPSDEAEGEVILLMGYPGAGKSTLAHQLEANGYERLNRDTRGGRVIDLLPELDKGIGVGKRHWVLDNTFPSRALRNRFIETAWAHGVPVRCVWLTTSREDAQVNAVKRLVQRYGRLPSPDELRAWGKEDPAAFGPSAQFRYERELEPPVPDEGYTRIDEVPFVRQRGAVESGRAIIMEYDEVLCTKRGGGEMPLRPDQVRLLPGRREVLRRYHAQGWKLLATAWRPQVEQGMVTADAVTACFAHTCQLLGIEIEFDYCPHQPGPPVCWCRKPLPGLPIAFAVRHGINLDQSVAVGRAPADRTLARRVGMVYRTVGEFFEG